MTKHYCDKCGAEMRDDTIDNVKIGKWVTCIENPCFQTRPTPYESYKSFHYDICNDCARKIISWIEDKKIDDYYEG